MWNNKGRQEFLMSNMKQNLCKNCGAHNFFEENGYLICEYCGSKFHVSSDNAPSPVSRISLNEDIKMLLKKCQDDPLQAHRYASLVLDIDPSNKEAIKYIRTNK